MSKPIELHLDQGSALGKYFNAAAKRKILSDVVLAHYTKNIFDQPINPDKTLDEIQSYVDHNVGCVEREDGHDPETIMAVNLCQKLVGPWHLLKIQVILQGLNRCRRRSQRSAIWC